MKSHHILTIIVLSWLLLSAAEFMQDSGIGGDNVMETVEARVKENDLNFIAHMGVAAYSFQVITPVMPLDDIPDFMLGIFPTIIYREYARLFLPDGYIAIPAAESIIYILLMLLLGSLIAISWKRRRKEVYTPIWIIIITVLLIIFMYPLWNALNIYLFEWSYSAIMDVTMEEAKVVYTGFATATTGFSMYYPLATVIGIIGLWKMISWSKVGWKG